MSPVGKIPVVDNVFFSHEQGNYPTTSPDENSIEFEFQTGSNVHLHLRQTYVGLKIKLVKLRSFDTYKTKEDKKKHEEENVSTETGDDDVKFIEKEGEGVAHLTHVNNTLHSFLSNAEKQINNHQI